MHKPTLEGLEQYLAGRMTSSAAEACSRHLDQCVECRRIVAAMQAQCGMVRALRSEAEPSPGFYARVMDRIEAQAANSFWGAFLEPFFSRGFVYASLALMMVLTLAAVNVGGGSPIHESVPVEMAVETSMPDAVEFGQPAREVVFVNLASFGDGFGGGAAVTALPTLDQ